MRSTRVILVDDHALFTQVARPLIEQQDGVQVVDVARTLRGARAAVLSLDPHVVLVSATLSDGTVEDLLSWASAELASPPRFVAIVDVGDVDHAWALLRSGASGVLTKSAPRWLLRVAIVGAAVGETWVEAALMSSMMRSLSVAERPTPGRTVGELTPRELEVLRLLAEGFGRERIGAELMLSVNTIRTHLTKVFSKLDVHSAIEAVSVARESGLLTPHQWSRTG